MSRLRCRSLADSDSEQSEIPSFFMPRAEVPRTRRPPPDLDRIDEPVLQDDTVWERVELTGDVSGQSGRTVEIVESRLLGARFAAVELDGLRVIQAVVNDC